MTAPKTPLRRALEAHRIKLAHAAKRCGLSAGAFNRLVNKHEWPRAALRTQDVRKKLAALLTEHNEGGVSINRLLNISVPKEKALHANAGPSPAATQNVAAHTPQPMNPAQPKDIDMLLAQQTISEQARQHFGLPPEKQPFLDDIQCAEDVFLTPDIRRVRQALLDNVKHGGILAVVGESGSGKSTLRRDLINRIEESSLKAIVVEPYVLAMEESDTKGKTLKSAHIAEALIRAIDPRAAPRRSPESRFAQLHHLLKDSHKAGNKHVLIIEEAHCLPTATLKHLKRFCELEMGFTRLLSIILIGQPELRHKLSEKNPEVREVVQRCYVVELAPLNAHVEAYLKLKFKRIGVALEKIINADGLAALQSLSGYKAAQHRRPGHPPAADSSLYPLAVGNLVVAAMNSAAELGVPLVTADVVRGL